MDSIRASEAPDTGSIPVEATQAALSDISIVRLLHFIYAAYNMIAQSG